MARLRVAIRADASAAIGTGHVRRCAALAHALVKGGAEVRFVLHPADGTAVPLMASLMTSLRCGCDWLDASASPGDARAVIEAMSSFNPQMVVVDHYGIGAAWHESVRTGLHCLVAAIDDLAGRPLMPDLLIDPNFHPDPQAKYQGMIPAATRLLAGPRFALLGPAYAEGPRYVFSESVRSIGIFMGGTDPVDACSAALRGCREVAGFTGPIEVVSSRLSPHFDALQALCATMPHATLVTDLPDLAAFFARHDLQVGAGGGATWERCCVGVPVIGCLVADNQKATLPHLQALGVLEWANPDGRFAPEDLRSGVGRCVSELVNDSKHRRSLARAGASLVDGRGAMRTAAVLDCAATRMLHIRPAAAPDESLLLDWANDPVVRANAFQPQRIEAVQHAAWFRARLAQPGRCKIFIACAGNGIPAGQVRFDWRDATEDGDPDPGYWEIGYSIDSSFRDLGLARPLLDGAIDALRKEAVPESIVGRVKPGNESSARVFRALGFNETAAADERGHFLLFTLDAGETRQ